MAVCEFLKSSGLDAARLAQTSPYGAGGPGINAGSQRHSWVETGARGSIVEISGVQEVDSVSSSPGVQKVCLNYLSFTFLKYLMLNCNNRNYRKRI